jgi:hypothetical protein
MDLNIDCSSLRVGNRFLSTVNMAFVLGIGPPSFLHTFIMVFHDVMCVTPCVIIVSLLSVVHLLLCLISTIMQIILWISGS